MHAEGQEFESLILHYITGYSSVWQSAAFGTQKSLVRIQLPRFYWKINMTYGIWHQTEYDIKIEIISYLGHFNGEAWWLVKGPDGGRTGVPESQISFYNKP